MTQAHLHAVTAARVRQLEADAAYITAIRQAREQGHSYTAIGRAAGVSKQAVRLTIIRNGG